MAGNGVAATQKVLALLISVLTLLSILAGIGGGLFYGGQWFEKTRSEIEETRGSVDHLSVAIREQIGLAQKERLEIREQVKGLDQKIVPRDEWDKQWRDHEKNLELEAERLYLRRSQ